MELWAIITLSVLVTFSATGILFAICDSISEHNRKKRRQREWYIETLKKLIERVDELECDIDCITEDIENITNDICVEEKYYEKFNRQNSNR